MKKALCLALGAITLGSATAWADSSDQMMSLIKSLQQQMSSLQQTIEAQNLRIQQLESTRVLETPHANLPVQASGASAATSDQDFQKNLKDNLGEAIPWMKGVKYGGDFRLRYEGFDYFDKNLDAGATDRSRNRFRIRLRWGMEKDFGDDWKAGFRLVTGSTTDPTSTNQSLGNSGYFNFKNILADRAYAAYEPNGLKDYGALKGVKISAGKVENPFLRYSTGIVWDADVTPEGLFEQVNIGLISTEQNTLAGQLTLGQFIVNENLALEADAVLYGYQGALNWSTYNFGTERPVEFAAGLSFYDYTNWFQTVLAGGNSAGTSYLRTNSITADNFRVLDFYPEITFYVNNSPVTLWYDYAVNTANVGTDDFVQSAGNDIHDADEGWGTGFKIGKTKAKGSWELFYGYYEIGANAVVAAFNDSDFGGPAQNGFTNRRGHKFGLGYQLTDNLTLGWTNYVVRPLNPFAGNGILGIQNSPNEEVWRTQVDALFKF